MIHSPQKSNARMDKLNELGALQSFNAQGNAEDRAQQEFTLRALQQFYGLQHEQQLAPEQLHALQLENVARQQGIDAEPAMNQAKLGEANATAGYYGAHTNYMAGQADELGDAKHAREFQQQAQALDRMYPLGHPMRDTVMNQLAEQFYPGISSATKPPTSSAQGAYGPGGGSGDPFANDPEFAKYNDNIAKGQANEQQQRQQSIRARTLDERRITAARYAPYTPATGWSAFANQE